MDKRIMLAVVAVIVATLSVNSVLCSDLDADTPTVAIVDGIEYKDINSVFNLDKTEYTIKLVNDCVGSPTVAEEKTVTLDLNGKTMTGNISVSGELVIVDSSVISEPMVNDDSKTVQYTSGKVTNSNTTISVRNGGSFILNSGTIESTNSIAIASIGNDGAEGSTITSTATINGGYVVAREFALSPQGQGASAIVNGGILLSHDNAVLAGNGTFTATKYLGNTTMEFNGGTLIGLMTESSSNKGYIACGIYTPNFGTLKVTGGTIFVDGGAGIVTRAGNTTISGCTIITTGAGTGYVGDSENTLPSSAIVIDSKANYPGAKKGFTNLISGGSFTSDATVQSITLIEDGVSSKDLIKIVGGAFSTDPYKLVDDGFVSSNVNGIYVVSEKHDIPTGGEIASSEGDAITVVGEIKDQTITTEVNSGKSDNTIVSITISGETTSVTVTSKKMVGIIDPSEGAAFDIKISLGGSSAIFDAVISVPVDVPTGKKAIVQSFDENGIILETHNVISYTGGYVVFETNHTTEFRVTFEDDDSYTPVGPDSDDDELPFIPPQSGDDNGADTTTYVAVAAAAAVVAILAVLAVGISKGKL